MTKNETPSLFSALLIGLYVNVMLRNTTGYWAQWGLLSIPFSSAILSAFGWLFARCWRAWPNWLFRWSLAAVLAFSSSLEVLRLWKLSAQLYPETITFLSLCVMALLPVLYLRRVSAIAQTANVLAALLFAAGLLMLLSILPRLRLEHLQTPPMEWDGLWRTAKAQIVLYPEYLLPALWPEQDKRGSHTLGRLSILAVGLDAGAHLVLELFFGAAMPDRLDPIHAAARSGALSIFNRLEWLQLLLWTMAVSVKLALYLYAMFRLCGVQGQKGTAVALERYPIYLAGMLLLCALLRKTDVQQALQWRNRAVWALAAAVWIGGGIAWVIQKQQKNA